MRDNVWARLGGCYFSDAYRVAINLALDSVWCGARLWQRELADALQGYVYENESPRNTSFIRTAGFSTPSR
jgi:endo-1,4-beta-D-glucanase Y